MTGVSDGRPGFWLIEGRFMEIQQAVGTRDPPHRDRPGSGGTSSEAQVRADSLRALHGRFQLETLPSPLGKRGRRLRVTTSPPQRSDANKPKGSDRPWRSFPNAVPAAITAKG